MVDGNHRSGRRRAIGLLLPALVLGGTSVGCREIPLSSLQPPSAASPSRYEAGQGDEQDDVEPAQDVQGLEAPASRDDVEPVQYVAASEAPPSRDPLPEAHPVES